MIDLLKTLAAAAIGLLVFVAINAVVPRLAFAGIGALNLAIQFAVVFTAGTIALRLGRYLNRRFDTRLQPRTFVLSLGGATLIWVTYSGIAGNGTTATLMVSVVAGGLAILAIWWQSGSAETD